MTVPYLKSQKERIDIFGINKRRFKSLLEYKTLQGLILPRDYEGHWFIHLSSKPDEIIEDRCVVMYLSTDNKDVICKANLVYDFEKKSMLIGDIKSEVENRGYGSLVLKSIISLANEIGAQEIIGNLSIVDSDHFDKLEHFYSKHGFDVSFHNDHSEGKLILRLSAN